MKTENSLPTSSPSLLHTCKYCNQALPLDSFYVNRTTLQPDKYCKQCRKAINHKRYKKEKLSTGIPPERLPYPVITQIEDRETRLQLIRNARQRVRLIVERKKKRIKEEEERRES
ncbi:hypothetical protein [Bacteroides sp. UBA939]|uniref:hypothetical protein n=1 Tax=Bacteroides sp. UBA939 TaxID=1946092 RepID=UPI0025BBAEDE|nr:hypothetical protein [Bacteroides sp. UBA939]